MYFLACLQRVYIQAFGRDVFTTDFGREVQTFECLRVHQEHLAFTARTPMRASFQSRVLNAGDTDEFLHGGMAFWNSEKVQDLSQARQFRAAVLC